MTSPSLQSALRPDLFADEARLTELGESLRAGRLIVRPQAFDPERTERMRASLDAAQGWQPYEGQESHFHYRHHNLYDPERFPPALRECKELFDSAASRTFIEHLSGRSCGGGTTLTAS